MASLSAQRKSEIAEVLRIAATWVHGPRAEKLHKIADELDGVDVEEPVQAPSQVAAPATDTTTP